MLACCSGLLCSVSVYLHASVDVCVYAPVCMYVCGVHVCVQFLLAKDPLEGEILAYSNFGQVRHAQSHTHKHCWHTSTLNGDAILREWFGAGRAYGVHTVSIAGMW